MLRTISAFAIVSAVAASADCNLSIAEIGLNCPDQEMANLNASDPVAVAQMQKQVCDPGLCKDALDIASSACVGTDSEKGLAGWSLLCDPCFETALHAPTELPAKCGITTDNASSDTLPNPEKLCGTECQDLVKSLEECASKAASAEVDGRRLYFWSETWPQLRRL